MRYVYFLDFVKTFRACISFLSSTEEYIKGIIVHASKCDLTLKKSYKYLLYTPGAFRSFASEYLTEIDKDDLKEHFIDLMTGNRELDGKIAIEKVQVSFSIHIQHESTNAVNLIATELVNQFCMVVENEIAIYEGKPEKYTPDQAFANNGDEQNNGLIEQPETSIEVDNVTAHSNYVPTDNSTPQSYHNTDAQESVKEKNNDSDNSEQTLADIYPDNQEARRVIHDCILDIVIVIDELLDLGKDISSWFNRQHGSAPFAKCPEWQQYQDSFKEYRKHNNHLQSYLKIFGCNDLNKKITSAIKLNSDSFWRCYPIRSLRSIITLDEINQYEMLLTEIANKLQEKSKSLSSCPKKNEKEFSGAQRDESQAPEETSQKSL